MKQVKYFEFFQEATTQNYESTSQVVDSLLRYDRLVVYRMKVTRNDNYWFMANILELTEQQFHFHKNRLRYGRELPAEYLVDMLIDLRRSILVEYDNEFKRAFFIVRDTIKLINIWIAALNRLFPQVKGQNVDNIEQ